MEPESGGMGVCPAVHTGLGEAAVMADAVMSRTVDWVAEAWVGGLAIYCMTLGKSFSLTFSLVPNPSWSIMETLSQ